MIKEFLDFSYVFNRKEKRLLWTFVAIYCIFALNIVPVDIPMALALMIFAVAPVHIAFYLFSFYVLFENVSVFSFGVTLNLLVQLLLVIKVVFAMTKRKYVFNLTGSRFRLLFLVYFLFYGIISFLYGFGFTGISIALRLFIACYALFFLQGEEDRHSFWKGIFHIMYISTLVSVAYGIFNETSLERYISGLESSYAMQLYGSLGTTRLGMFTVCSLTYPLYFVKNKQLKWLLIVVMVVFTFLTVSMTAIATLGLLVLIYFISIGRIRQMFKLGVIFLFLLIATYGIWSNLSFVQPIMARFEFAKAALEYGDMNALTSERAELSDIYMSNFRNRNIVSQYIGIFNADGLDESIGKYSHNTYIDILGYSGIIGVILMLLYSFKNVLVCRKTGAFFPVLTLKLVMIVPAFTVSVFNSLYWTWFIFL